MGNWNSGEKHGRGTYYFDDGDKYAGNWVDGRKHGVVVYDSVDGRTDYEHYIYGKLVSDRKYEKYVQKNTPAPTSGYVKPVRRNTPSPTSKTSSSKNCYAGAAQSAFGMITAFANALSGNKDGVAQGAKHMIEGRMACD